MILIVNKNNVLYLIIHLVKIIYKMFWDESYADINKY